MKTYCTVLTIGGSDSGGGAGIQADLKTFAALGCYGMSALTALTAQNTRTVEGVYPVPADFVVSQIDAVFGDMEVGAVKIGMLHHVEIIKAVGACLERYSPPKVVLDPVMVSTGGDRLLEQGGEKAFEEYLFPRVSLVTPNIPEALALLGKSFGEMAERVTEEDMQSLCKDLGSLGMAAVLLKGGHAGGEESNDTFHIPEKNLYRLLRAPRVETSNTHGTGCTLSSAVAAYLAKGLPLEEAVVQGKSFLYGALQRGKGYTLGEGHGPVCFFD